METNETAARQYGVRLDKKKIAYLQREKPLDYKEAVYILRKIEEEKITFETEVGLNYQKELQNYILMRKKRRKIVTIKVCCYVILLAALSFWLLEGFFVYCSRRNMNSLQQKVEMLREQFAVSEESIRLTEQKWQQELVAEEQKKEELAAAKAAILPQYRELAEKNPYFYGWLEIEDTEINYPVMYGPDNEYYLSHNMDNEYDKYGLLILDTRNTQEAISPQYLIYGHNARTGDMFGALKKYKSEEYYTEHPTVTFDSLYKSESYNIVAVFCVSLEDTEGEELFYRHTDFDTEDAFCQYIEDIKAKALYDTGITPGYKTPLVTLVTCESSIKDGRFVVVCAKGRET